VNARTSDVTAFESDADVKAFFAGAVVPGEDEGPSIEDVQEKIAEIEAILASLKELLAELAEEET
jgi:hypothetical protein